MRIRELSDPDDAPKVVELFAEVWQLQPTDPTPVEAATLIALAHGGNYVALAEADRDDHAELLGACVGFLTVPKGAAPARTLSLHSHIAGVLPGHTGAGIGRALKLHQRDWCRARGIESITWTFDPLVSRNAHFNLNRLGGRATEYLINFYGELSDGLNAGQPSDRLLVRWDLTAEAPRQEPGEQISVGVPDDIEALRVSDPAAALDWRYRLRRDLTLRLDDGWSITGFVRGQGYRLSRIGVDPTETPTQKESG